MLLTKFPTLYFLTCTTNEKYVFNVINYNILTIVRSNYFGLTNIKIVDPI